MFTSCIGHMGKHNNTNSVQQHQIKNKFFCHIQYKNLSGHLVSKGPDLLTVPQSHDFLRYGYHCSLFF